MTCWKVIFLLQLFLAVSCQHNDQESLCAFQQTCGECIRIPKCVWCSTTVSEQNTTGALVRCVTREKHEKEGDLWCQRADVVDHANFMELLEDRPLSSIKGKEPVQLRPQRMRLRLRIGEEYHVTIKYKQAEDYPVDLYYLMDLSASMELYRNDLSILGLKLAEAMSKLTSNFRLGFGSFVDKVALPMTNTQPEKLKSPCVLSSTGGPCAAPYGFKNQMPLTESVDRFKSQVQEAPVSGNLDSPEGGLDALMQVIVCTKEIGWRQKARHLVVYSTDASFHIAGDGKLAGIVEPNDSLCHLDKNGFYNHSLLQDYPSISQINKKSREHNVNIIFAVPAHKSAIYRLLSRSISGSSIGTIERDSQNVVTLVRGEYEKLVDTLMLTDNAPNFIDVKYFSRCLNLTGEMKERNECGGLRVGNVIEFDVAIKVIECPADAKERTTSLQIKPRGINESLSIDLEIVCDCACAEPGHPGYQPNADQCKGTGTLICGVCSCNDGYYGKQCECEAGESDYKTLDFDTTIVASDLANCKPNNESDEICSGHGVCKCGLCNCNLRPNPQELFYGKYCECDNFSCKRSSGKICGGRGKCECGTCNCLPGWAGETCDCKQTNTTCRPANEENAEICSGRGDCICGSCHCHERDNIRYSGQYCEECPTCPEQKCEELKDCVECMAYGTGPYAANGKCDTCLHQIAIEDVVVEDPVKDREVGAHICRTPGDAGCTFIFKYGYFRSGQSGDIKLYKITVQKDRICPIPINILGVALGVVISTLFLGLLFLLIWKIFTMIHDKREYEKFEKERALAKWDRGDNPLYKQATSTFRNPMFSGE